MKTLYHISVAALLLATSALLYAQKSVYTFPFDNSCRLKGWKAELRMDEMSNTYQTLGNVFTTEITGLGDKTMEQRSYSFISDTKVVDAVRFLEFYLEEQLVASGEEQKGTVETSIIYFHEHLRFSAGSMFGILTLGLGSLFGVPFATNITDVEIEASFFGPEEQFITLHRGIGRGKKAMSIYTMTTRKAHQKALRKAIEDLNSRIMSDSLLSAELTEIRPGDIIVP